jgi:1,4-alpha-glucan branching enzyme
MRITFTLLFLACLISAKSQLLSWSPAFIQESSDPVEITVDATKGNQGLKDYTPTSDVYVHIGVITNKSTGPGNWLHVKYQNFNSPSPTVQCTYVSANKWKFTITGGLRAFFGVTDATEKIQKIAILFRNGAGTQVQRNADGSDMYVPVYDAGFYVRIDQPYKEPKYTPVTEPINKNLGDNIDINGKSSQSATLKLYFNGSQVGTTATNATSISATANITDYGNQTIVAQASNANGTKYDTVTFYVNAPNTVAPLPAGVRDGINYEQGDTSVTLVLFAPDKSRVAVIGDFNNWTQTPHYQMNKTPDGNRYWLRITGLTPGVEYAYQYLIDGTLKVADYLTEKVLDPDNDKYIPAANYPNLKPYPAGKTTGIVSVLQTAKPVYNWQVSNFSRPDKRNLIIYELLVRDFVATQNWQTVKDSISYLKKLGINAIEVMPFNEFEGNNSWGYNPDFYLAPDKMYGTETALKQFIDECHKQGIAVIMDMVLNHSFGSSPMVQMYFDATKNVPAANSPWFNQYATHAYNVGYQFNHESQATKDFTQRVLEHWLTKYHIDGYRFDLAKGFTQKRTCDATGNNCDVNAWSAYDQSRVNIWDTIYKQQQQISPGSYTILEMFADNSEETVYANQGMMVWGNLNYSFNQATMGYNDGSDFSWGIYKARNWSQPGLVTYQESHDEERLMYKNEQYGNSNGGYNIKQVATGLKRDEMATAFWSMIPAPKMLWQFGELGYDYSINYCENGTISNQCRVSPKPIRWDYLTDPNRKALHDVYAKLLTLRNVPNFLSTFVTSDVTWNLAGTFKWLKVNSDSLDVLVVGNFDVTTQTGSVAFQKSGTWYDYLSGGTRTATGGSESLSLQPGEYHVYLSRNVNPLVNALPLKLISFKGRRSNESISLTWITSNEVNVKHFLVQRSFDGTTFTTISTVAARNIENEQQTYGYADRDASAVKSHKKVYYRLKMVDLDGKYTYSSVAIIHPSSRNRSFSLYPNPVKGSDLYVALDDDLVTSAVQVKIEDVTGRVYGKWTCNPTSDGLIPVDVKNLKSGVYLLKTENLKTSYVQQFIVQH